MCSEAVLDLCVCKVFWMKQCFPKNHFKYVFSECFVKSCVYTLYRPLKDWQFLYRKDYCYTILSACCYIKHCEPAPDWPKLCALIVDWLKAEETKEKCPGLEFHLNYRVG